MDKTSKSKLNQTEEDKKKPETSFTQNKTSTFKGHCCDLIMFAQCILEMLQVCVAAVTDEEIINNEGEVHQVGLVFE